MPKEWRSSSGLYHITIAGCGKQIIFESDDDRWDFLSLIKAACADGHISIVAWCLMSNHVHLVLSDPSDAVSVAMQRALTAYARDFNRKTGRCGHLFKNRFGRFAIETESYLLATIRYVHANPQAAGICTMDKYRWSSFREYLSILDGNGRAYLCDAIFVERLFRDYLDFLSFMYSKFEGESIVIRDFDESDLERRERSDQFARQFGYGLADLKTLVPAYRDRLLFELGSRGFSTRELERYTGVSRSTVSRIMRAYRIDNEKGDGADSPPP